MPNQITAFSITIVLVFSALASFAQRQEELAPLTARPSEYPENISKRKAMALLTLPVFDDFSYRRSRPDSSIWMDDYVFVNFTMGIDPISLGVATFDGLDQYGRAYDINRNPLDIDTADILTSHPIDLSNTRGSTVLSFYYQPTGLGESPSTDDSLTLYFYSPETNKWNSVWKTTGPVSNDITLFERVDILVDSSIYLQTGFQFRFISYGSQAGAFDIWNLDYVRLDDNQNLSDTTFTDPAFVVPPPSLLESYRAIPWFHYTQDIAQELNATELELAYRRNKQDGTPDYSLNLAIYSIRYDGSILAGDNTGNLNLDNDDISNAINIYTTPLAPFPLPSTPTDEFEIICINTYSGIANLSTNDSLITRQIFRNYYAYDDGSAEKIYQVKNNEGGFIISKFDILQPDTLKGIYLYFVPGEYHSTENEFSIVIYENNGGLPGNIIYESDSLYVPEYSDQNFYMPYLLDNGGVYLNAPAFIGIRQQNNIRMTLGFDKNSLSKTTSFYGTETDFSQSFLEGTIMIRPFFKYIPRDISIPEKPEEKVGFRVYPNPGTGIFRVIIDRDEENELFGYRLFSISGQALAEGIIHDATVDVSHLVNGVYLLQIYPSDAPGKARTQKVIINR